MRASPISISVALEVGQKEACGTVEIDLCEDLVLGKIPGWGRRGLRALMKSKHSRMQWMDQKCKLQGDAARYSFLTQPVFSRH